MFDAYHKWLGIPKDQQPPTYYQLLGICPDEDDPEVIRESGIRQTSYLRTYQTGRHAALCIRLLNEVAQAEATLLNPVKRAEYDAHLREEAAEKQPFEGPLGDIDFLPEVGPFPEVEAIPQAPAWQEPDLVVPSTPAVVAIPVVMPAAENETFEQLAASGSRLVYRVQPARVSATRLLLRWLIATVYALILLAAAGLAFWFSL